MSFAEARVFEEVLRDSNIRCAFSVANAVFFDELHGKFRLTLSSVNSF